MGTVFLDVQQNFIANSVGLVLHEAMKFLKAFVKNNSLKGWSLLSIFIEQMTIVLPYTLHGRAEKRYFFI